MDSAAWKQIMEECMEKDMLAIEDARRLIKYLTPDSVVLTPGGKTLRGDEVKDPETVLEGAPPTVLAYGSLSGAELAKQAATTASSSAATIRTSSGGDIAHLAPQRGAPVQYKTLRFKPKNKDDYDLCCQMARQQFPGATIIIETPKPKALLRKEEKTECSVM